MHALVVLKTCYECTHSLASFNQNGMKLASCMCADMDQKTYAKLCHQCDEDTLPSFCGHFSPKVDRCHICQKKMNTVTFVSTLEGMVPICSSMCAKKME